MRTSPFERIDWRLSFSLFHLLVCVLSALSSALSSLSSAISGCPSCCDSLSSDLQCPGQPRHVQLENFSKQIPTMSRTPKRSRTSLSGGPITGTLKTPRKVLDDLSGGGKRHTAPEKTRILQAINSCVITAANSVDSEEGWSLCHRGVLLTL